MQKKGKLCILRIVEFLALSSMLYKTLFVTAMPGKKKIQYIYVNDKTTSMIFILAPSVSP